MGNWPALRAVASRPGIWGEAMRALWALGDRRWWRRIWSGPQADHLAWRIGTAYGDTTHQLEGEDLVAFLRWRRTMRRARR